MANRTYFSALDNDGDANNTVREGKTDLHWIFVHNGDDTPIFLNLYDALHGDVNPAATAPTISLGVPALTSLTIPLDISFTTAVVVCASTTAAAGGSAPSPAPTVTVFHT